MQKRLALVAVALVLAGCETTNEDEWTSAAGGTPFDQAEDTCETQLEFIESEEGHQRFFVDCMAAYDWRPRPGTPFANPETAPDPD